MNKNYANDSDLVKIAIDETLAVYSASCKNVVILFNNKKASAGLSSISFPVCKKKEIIDKCNELGLPNKMLYTELEGSQEKYFCAEKYNGEDALMVRQFRLKGQDILVVDVAPREITVEVTRYSCC